MWMFVHSAELRRLLVSRLGPLDFEWGWLFGDCRGLIGFLRPSHAAPVVAPKAHAASRTVEVLVRWWGSVLAKADSTCQVGAIPGDSSVLATGADHRRFPVLPLCQGSHSLFCHVRITTDCVAPTLFIQDGSRDGHFDVQCSRCNPSCHYERQHVRSSLPRSFAHDFGYKSCDARKGNPLDRNAFNRPEGFVMPLPAKCPCQNFGTVCAAVAESRDVEWSCLVLLHLHFEGAVRTCLLLYLLAAVRMLAEACPLKAGCDKRNRAVTYCRRSFRGAPLCLVFAFALHCLPGCQAVRMHGPASGMAVRPHEGGSAERISMPAGSTPSRPPRPPNLS